MIPILFSLLLAVPPAEDAPHQKIDPARIQEFERQPLRVADFPAQGLILDIGGGGEGVIGLIKGEQVVAIDLSRRELAEAPPGPLKLVMDATDLKFIDRSFSTATCFFTFMYMSAEQQAKAMKEAHRVLKPGGRFLVWDVSMPAKGAQKDVGLFRFRFQLPKEEVQTGYGAFMAAEPHGLKYFIAMAQGAGFEVAAQREEGNTFFLELRKGQSGEGGSN